LKDKKVILKPKEKTGLEDLMESELIAILQSGQDPRARIELENRGVRVALIGTG